MLKIIQKRWPLLEVLIVDTLVQGEAAAGQIAQSLRFADGLGADVVLVGRGGGSTEDLWAFNEEVVADAIFRMQTPVVSAVGHEVDVLISDYVADLRAPTPSAAMEMILPDRNEILYLLDERMERFVQSIGQRIGDKEQKLQYSKTLLLQHAPDRKLREIQLSFGRLQEEFSRTLHYRFEQYGILPQQHHKEFVQSIAFVLRNKQQQLESLQDRMRLSDPSAQCRSGWAQVSKGGRRISLDKIGENEQFTIEDASVRIEAVSLGITKKNVSEHVKVKKDMI
jgi:exodeoxyribonuclease VII large subunit